MPRQQVWTVPSAIPWDEVARDQWNQAHITPRHLETLDLDQRVESFARDYEDSFKGHLKNLTQLPNNHKGRCQRHSPEERMATAPVLRKSRPDEVAMSPDSLGRSVQAWFKQLLRLQSLLHNVRANKGTAASETYKIELWASITRAKGFEGGFRRWWEVRPVKLAGLPAQLPSGPPTQMLLEGIFHDFETNYRKYESWRSRQRFKVLQAQYLEQSTKVFDVVKKEPKGGINYLAKRATGIVIGQSDEGDELQIDRRIPQGVPLTVEMEGKTLMAKSMAADRLQLEEELLVQPGVAIDVMGRYVTPTDIQDELAAFWKQRWWKESPPQASDWQRILNFAQAYLPRGTCPDVQITTESWTEINKRYGPHAARGPDGLDKNDLRFMPTPFKEELVDILQACEKQQEWPKAWLRGFVHSLAKREGASQATRLCTGAGAHSELGLSFGTSISLRENINLDFFLKKSLPNYGS